MTDERTEDKGREGRQSRIWHMNREVSIPDIVAVLAVLVSLAAWIFTIRSDVNLHYQELKNHIEADVEARTTDRAVDQLILKKLDGIERQIVDIKVEQALRYGRFQAMTEDEGSK